MSLLLRVEHNQAVWERTIFYIDAPIGMESIEEATAWAEENLDDLLTDAVAAGQADVSVQDSVLSMDSDVKVEVQT